MIIRFLRNTFALNTKIVFFLKALLNLRAPMYFNLTYILFAFELNVFLCFFVSFLFTESNVNLQNCVLFIK
jgi:hypothetical protein